MTTNEQDTRESRGRKIAERNDVSRISDDLYTVKSQRSDVRYSVIRADDKWSCSCPDHKYRNRVCCKHIHAVEFSIKFRKEVKQRVDVTIDPFSINSCISCKSQNIKKYGLRHNKNYDIQRFICQDCHKTFSVNIGFEKMKHDPKGITMAMQLYFSGESLRNVSKSLKLIGMEVTHQTVYNWIKKYTGLMEEYLQKIVPNVSDTWRADEIFIKFSGNMKYMYALLDEETRFWIAKQVADTKYTQDIRPMFQDAKKFTEKRPRVLITDGARNFETAYRRELFTISNPRTQHIRHIHMKRDMNNNKMERLNGEIRDREKTMRGLKKMETPILEGYRIFHNYVRPHEGLEGKTPADAAGIKIGGTNKWITLIQNASIKES